MDKPSTVKYQKFAGSTEESQGGRTFSKSIIFKHKIAVGFLIAIAITLIAIAMIVGIGVGFGVGFGFGSSSEESGQMEVAGLTINSNSEWKLEGKYYGSAGGIHFLSTANKSQFYLSITTINGEPVVTVKHPLDSNMTMMTANDTSFMVMKNQLSKAKYVDYLIPKAYINLMESAIEKGRMTSELFQLLDSTQVNETRHRVLEGLATSLEGSLIIEAAKALGDSHVYGDDYRTAARLYLLALQLENIRNSLGELQYGSIEDTPGSRQKRVLYNPWDNDNCQRYPSRSDDCLGMCGPGCTCWRRFCKDCCFHQFCYDHDRCCDGGYATLSCAGVVRDILSFPSVCSQHYYC